MGYVLAICGIVLVGSIIFALVYSFFNKKYDLDDVRINSREDRKYGSSELDYDYDDDDRVELFDDMIDFARKAEEEDFDRTVDEINKFVARRLPNTDNTNSNVDDIVSSNGNDGFVAPNLNVLNSQPVMVQPTVVNQGIVNNAQQSQPVVNQSFVNTPQVQLGAKPTVNNVLNQTAVVQKPVNVVSLVNPVQQQPVQNTVSQVGQQPVLQKLDVEQQSLFEQINIEGPDDYVEEL